MLTTIRRMNGSGWLCLLAGVLHLLAPLCPACPALNPKANADAMGRVTAESSHGQVHHYEYDLAGNRVKATYSTGRVVETSYDGLNRPEAIVDDDRLTRYGYDKAGRAVILIAANGQTSSNTYDALGRLTDRVLYKTPAMDPAQRLAQFKWQHDLLGNVTKQEEIWPGEATRAAGVRSTTMGYDDNNRLTSETISHPTEGTQSTTYTYDNANNRSTKTVTGGAEPGHWDYTYNVANQLTAWDHLDYPGGSVLRSATLTYDDAGNRTSQTLQEQGTPNRKPRTTAYTWDAQDRLASVTLPGQPGTENSEPRTFTYAYDYRTRRISTGVRTPSSANETKTSIVFSGGLSVAEWESSGSQPSTLNFQPTVEYTRGPDMGGGVGGLLYTSRSESASASVSSSRTLRYNLSNARGDIVAQSDAYASLTWTASYEAYGKRTKETGSNQDKQRGNSKDEDPTGMLNEGFRYRDIETGVWLSRDPAGFVDGPNLYAYVKQNPWTAWDPDGLAEKKRVYQGSQQLRDEKPNLGAKLYKVTGDTKTGEVKFISVSAKDIQKKNATIWINGILNDPQRAAELGAFHTGKSEFYMIHNPTNGGLSDLGEASAQKLGFRTKIADSTRDSLKNFDLKTANITAHSQGTLILNNALRDLHSWDVDMKGMTLNYHGAAANIWRTFALSKEVGANVKEFKGHALDPVHNVVGGNTLNPLRLVCSLAATPLIFSGDRDKSPHSKDEGQAKKINPMFHTNPLFHPLVPSHH